MARTGQAELISREEIDCLQGILRAINDANRIRIINLLFEGEKCVCDIERQLRISQPLASHHLGVLREAGLVSVRRSGTWAYYSLRREAIEEASDLFMRVLGKQRFPAEYPSREECEGVEERERPRAPRWSE